MGEEEVEPPDRALIRLPFEVALVVICLGSSI